MHAYPVSARFIVCSTIAFICTEHISPFARAPTRTIFFALRRTSTFALTKGRHRFLSKRNSLSWAFAVHKVDLNAKYMQNSSTHRYFHNGGRAWQVSERVKATAHVNPWQCPFNGCIEKFSIGSFVCWFTVVSLHRLNYTQPKRGKNWGTFY